MSVEGRESVPMQYVGEHNGRLHDLDYGVACLTQEGYQFTAAARVKRVRDWLASQPIFVPAQTPPAQSLRAALGKLADEWEATGGGPCCYSIEEIHDRCADRIRELLATTAGTPTTGETK